METLHIAVDAMGGDNAPAVVIEGVADSLRDHNLDAAVQIILVGREKEIRKELKRFPHIDLERIEIVDAQEAITMREQLFSYWRRKADTSIQKGGKLRPRP